ncbi:MAG: winged helix-turn-helix domain-containing protein [Verrucomicrobiota bacterium]|jgi:hypothetical protein
MKQIITLDRVRRAMDHLADQNRKPTLLAIRAFLRNRGSLTTVRKFRAEIEAGAEASRSAAATTEATQNLARVQATHAAEMAAMHAIIAAAADRARDLELRLARVEVLLLAAQASGPNPAAMAPIAAAPAPGIKCSTTVAAPSKATVPGQSLQETASDQRMTFRDIGIRALEEAQKPLSLGEICDMAEKLGWIKLLDSKGKTPLASIRSKVYTECRKPHGQIVRVGKKFRLRARRPAATRTRSRAHPAR